MCFPALSPPTKLIALISGCSQSVLTTSLAPWMTFNTPAGRPGKYIYTENEWHFSIMGNIPARSQSSARIIDAPGSRSDGLRTSVFPVTIAIGMVHNGIILETACYQNPDDMIVDVTHAGKLKGAILRTGYYQLAIMTSSESQTWHTRRVVNVVLRYPCLCLLDGCQIEILKWVGLTMPSNFSPMRWEVMPIACSTTC